VSVRFEIVEEIRQGFNVVLELETAIAFETVLELRSLEVIEETVDSSASVSSLLGAHIGDLANPHTTDVGNLGAGTLLELNTAIIDATLDDSGDPRAPTAHAPTHANGGGDDVAADTLATAYAPVNYGGGAELSAHLAGIDAAIGGAGVGDVIGPAGATDEAIVRFNTATGKLVQDSLATIDDVGNIATPGTVDGRDVSADGVILDATSASLSSHLGDLANPHATDVGNLGAGTLADLNLVVTDATLDDVSGARIPLAHAATHENGGVDEVNMAGLSGLLADPQTPLAHAPNHSQGGADEIDAADLGSGVAGAAEVLTADGVGGAAWAAIVTGDELVGVTATDTTPGYLDAKVSPGAGLTRTVTNPAANEGYRLDVGANIDGSIVVNPDDIQVGVLASDPQHGNRGGGSLHALVVAAGAAGFMAGADKTKLDGIAAGASATFVGLTDTAGALVGDQFARSNAGGTSLDMFDLFGTANTFSAAQTINAQLNMGGDVLPTTNQVRDIGSGSLRFRRVRGQIADFVSTAGTSTVALPAATSKGGLLAGSQGGNGTNVHRLDGGAFPAIACIGNAATTNVGGSATIEAIKGGAIAFGSAYAYGTGLATVRASGYSAFTAGYAYGSGTSLLEATNSGSVAFGYANGRSSTGTAQVRSTGNGSFVSGFCRVQAGSGTSLILSSGAGAFAAGYEKTTGGNVTIQATQKGAFAQGDAESTNAAATATIEATNTGSFAQGRASGSASGSARITSSAAGSFAQGCAKDGGIIEATFDGSIALGFSNSAANQIASHALNAAQFGPGTNAQADSLQVGAAGLRLKGTAGSPTTPQVGDLWVNVGGYLQAQTPTGNALAFTRPAITGSRAGNAALASLLSQLATMGLIVDSSTA